MELYCLRYHILFSLNSHLKNHFHHNMPKILLAEALAKRFIAESKLPKMSSLSRSNSITAATLAPFDQEYEDSEVGRKRHTASDAVSSTVATPYNSQH